MGCLANLYICCPF